MPLPASTILHYRCDQAPGAALLDAYGDTNYSLTPWGTPATTSADFWLFRVRDDGLQGYKGALCKVLLLNDFLTGAELTDTYNGGAGRLYAALQAGVQAKITAGWDLSEAGGVATWADSSGRGNALTVVGTSDASVTGPGGAGTAVHCDGLVYGWRASNADLSFGNAKRAIVLWVKPDSLTPPGTGDVQSFIGKWPGGLTAGNSPAFIVYMNRHAADANVRFQADWGDGLAGLAQNGVVIGDSTHKPAAATWAMLYVEFDPAPTGSSAIRLYVDTALAGTCSPVAQPEKVAALVTGTAGAAKWSHVAATSTASGYDAVGRHYARKATPGTKLKWASGTAKWGWAWLKFDDTTGNQCVLGIYDSTSGKLNNLVQASGGDLYFLVGTGANSSPLNFKNTPISDTAKHLWCWGVRTSDSKVWLRKDNGAILTAALTITIGDATGVDFLLAACNAGTGTAQQFKGTIDAWGIATGEPTTQELDDLWNAGAGIELGTGYTLTAASGSFTLTGQAAGLLVARRLTAAAGSFTLTGQSANLLAARRLVAASGSFTLTGQPANFLKGRTLTADAGTFALTGQPAALRRTLLLPAGIGTFTLTGAPAALLAGRRLVAAPGTYALTGQPAALTITSSGPLPVLRVAVTCTLRRRGAATCVRR